MGSHVRTPDVILNILAVVATKKTQNTKAIIHLEVLIADKSTMYAGDDNAVEPMRLPHFHHSPH